MDFFNDIFHNLALLEFYFLNIIYILLYIDFILSIFFQHSNILTRASHHWCLASNIVLVLYCDSSPPPPVLSFSGLSWHHMSNDDDHSKPGGTHCQYTFRMWYISKLKPCDTNMHRSMYWTIIGSENGFTLVLQQIISWTNVKSSSIGPSGTNFSKILI